MDDTGKIIKLIQRVNNYPGYEKLVRLVQQKNPDISRQKIKEFLKQDETTQLTTVQIKKSADGHITAFQPNESWQMDIFDLSRYKYFNQDYKYIMAVVDVFTRKAYVEPMKNKDSVSCVNALNSIMNKAHNKPRVILSDNDAAYLNKPFQDLLNSKQIMLHTNALHDHKALGIIDNFARRIKGTLTKVFLDDKNTRWTNKIEGIVSNYNFSEHSGIANIAPASAKQEKNQAKILDLNMAKNQHNKTISDLKVGDSVRKNILKDDAHAKGTDPRWSNEVFTVTATRGHTITLNDNSRYKRSDLLKVPSNARTIPEHAIREARRINREIDAK